MPKGNNGNGFWGKAFAAWSVTAFLAYLSPIIFADRETAKTFIWLFATAVFLPALFYLSGSFLSRSIFSARKGCLANEKSAELAYWSLACGALILIFASLSGDIFIRQEWASLLGIAKGMGAIFKEAFCSLALLWSSWALGKKSLQRIFPGNDAINEEPVFGLALGLLEFSLIFLGLGLAGLFYSWVAWAIIAVAATIFRKELRLSLRRFSSGKLRLDPSTKSVISFNGLAWMVLGIIFWGFFISMSANVLSGASDTFHQYLTFPDQYAKNHGIVEFLYHPHFGFPQSVEMIYAWGILLGGTGVPFAAAFFVLAFSFVAFGRIILGFRNGSKIVVWPLLMLATVPFIFGFGMGYLKVEPFLLLEMLAAFGAVKKYLERKDGPYLALAFVFFAASLDIKYTGAFVIASAFLAFSIMHKDFGFYWKKAFVFAAISAAVFLPWALKDIHYYGNPIYPILDGEDNMSDRTGISCQSDFVRNSKEDMYVNYKGNSRLLDSGSYVLANSLIFLKKAFVGWNENAMDAGPWLGIFLLPALAWLFISKDRFVLFLGWFFLAYLVFWITFMAGQLWYLLPAIAAFLLIVADMLANCQAVFFGKTIRFVMISWVLLETMNFFLIGDFENKIAFIRGETDLAGIFRRIKDANDNDQRYDSWKIDSYVNERIVKDDPNALIYGFEDMRDGYFIRDSYRHFVPDLFGYAFDCLSSDGNAYANLRKLGVKYFILDSRFSPTCASEANQRKFAICKAEKDFERFLMLHGNVLLQSGNLSLVELK